MWIYDPWSTFTDLHKACLVCAGLSKNPCKHLEYRAKPEAEQAVALK